MHSYNTQQSQLFRLASLCPTSIELANQHGLPHLPPLQLAVYSSRVIHNQSAEKEKTKDRQQIRAHKLKPTLKSISLVAYPWHRLQKKRTTIATKCFVITRYMQ